jgi:serine/threonine protein kinase
VKGTDGPQPLPEVRSGRYVDFRVAGAGGMGIVYLALDTELNRRVAFKIVRPDLVAGAAAVPDTPAGASPPSQDSPASEAFEQLKARFLQEAWVTSGLEHPGIVPVYELGRTSAGVPYYTMRFVRGERTLRAEIDAVREQPLARRLELLEPFLRLCDTVGYAHARGVVHRDLKPENVALGEFGEVVLLDWGLARVEGADESRDDAWRRRVHALREETALHTVAGFVGTPGFLAPEVALGEGSGADALSDVYSLGAVLYEVVCGQPHLEFRTLAEFLERIRSETPRAPRDVDGDVPAELERICLLALERDRARRIPSASELASRIRAWQAASVVEREVDRLLRDAAATASAAESLHGDALLRQADRAATAVGQVLARDPGHAEALGLQARVEALRARGLAERESHLRRSFLLRAGAGALVVLVLAGVGVGAALNRRRVEAEVARGDAERSKESEARARASAEDILAFLLRDLREGLQPIGRIDLLEAVARRSAAYYDTLPEGALPGSAAQRATAQEILGDVFRAEGDVPRAVAAYGHSLAISGEAAEPGGSPRVEAVRAKLGDALHDRWQLAEALDAHRAGVATWEGLLAASPGAPELERPLASAFVRMGDVLASRRRPEEALAAYRRAYLLRHGLAEHRIAEDRGSREELAESYERLAQALVLVGRRSVAEDDLVAAVEIREELVREDPTHLEWLLGLQGALEQLGDVQAQRGDRAAAIPTLRRSASIAQSLAARDRDNLRWQARLARVLGTLGARLRSLDPPEEEERKADREHREAEGLALLREAAATAARVREASPDHVRWQLESVPLHLALTDALFESSKGVEAAAAGEVAMEALERAVDLDHGRVEWLAHALGRWRHVALVYREHAQREASLRRLERAAASADRWPASHADREVLRAAADVDEDLGEQLFSDGAPEKALAVFERLLARRRAYGEGDPGDPHASRGVPVALASVAAALRALSRTEEALARHREARDAVASLRARAEGAWVERVSGRADLELARTLAVRGERERSLRTNARSRRAHEEAYGSPGERDRDLLLALTDNHLLDMSVHRDLRRFPAMAESARAALAVREEARVSQMELRTYQGYVRVAELLAGEREPESAQDHLLAARGHYWRREHASALRHYRRAIADEGLRADLESGALYETLQAAALVAGDQGTPEARDLRAEAIEWLREDVRRRRERVARLPETTPPEERDRLRKATERFLRHARVEDEELAPLRRMPAFDAVFEEPPPR